MIRIILLTLPIILLLFMGQCSNPNTYHVALSGNDLTGDGSVKNPWRTLGHAASTIEPNKGSLIKLSAGTFIEKNYIKLPPGVNVMGSGMGTTILKPDTMLYSKLTDWVFDRFLIILTGSRDDNINQTLSNFTVDGVAKNLYGAILVKDRDNVKLVDLDIRETFYTGIWLWGTKDCHVSQVKLTNCAWGSEHGSSATIQFTACEGLEVDHLKIHENIGYGLKAVGDGNMHHLKIHDNEVYVTPEGKWKTPAGHTAPNIACELYNVDLKGCEINGNYFNANVSVAMDKKLWVVPPEYQTIRVHNNTFDFISQAGGRGHGLELTLHNAEVDHNYFTGGSSSIVNWDASDEAHTMHNWKIHHNIFYKLTSFYPSAVINFFRKGINNAHIYNNTVELTDTSTINFIEVNNGGIANNVVIENNLIINSSTSFRWYPNKVVSIVNNGRFKNSLVANNSFYKIDIDSVDGVKFTNNTPADPKIKGAGSRPKPYYSLLSESPLVDKGLKVHNQYSGRAPDIGALELEVTQD